MMRIQRIHGMSVKCACGLCACGVCATHPRPPGAAGRRVGGGGGGRCGRRTGLANRGRRTRGPHGGQPNLALHTPHTNQLISLQCSSQISWCHYIQCSSQISWCHYNVAHKSAEANKVADVIFCCWTKFSKMVLLKENGFNFFGKIFLYNSYYILSSLIIFVLL